MLRNDEAIESMVAQLEKWAMETTSCCGQADSGSQWEIDGEWMGEK